MQTGSPHLEFMGWTAQPRLLDRLLLHWVAAAVELGATICEVWLAARLVASPAIFVYFLIPPMLMLCIKICWASCMGVAYLAVRRVDYATAVRRMSLAHSRSFWTLASPAFSCMSWLLLLWYFVGMIVVMGSSTVKTNRTMMAIFLGFSSFFLFLHWGILIDYVRSEVKPRISDADEMQLELLLHMFRSQRIKLAKLGELAQKVGAPSEDAAQVCFVCLENLAEKEHVAQLPCGHTFHPACVHKWLRQDWRCPLRCALNVPIRKPRSPPALAGEGDLQVAEVGAFTV